MTHKYVIGYGFSTGTVADRMIRGGADTLAEAKAAARKLDCTYWWGEPQVARVDGGAYTFICHVRGASAAPRGQRTTLDPVGRTIIGDMML
jgi:hypothetical protein